MVSFFLSFIYVEVLFLKRCQQSITETNKWSQSSTLLNDIDHESRIILITDVESCRLPTSNRIDY